MSTLSFAAAFLLTPPALGSPSMPRGVSDDDLELRERVHEGSQSCRIVTDLMEDEDPPCLRVTELRWDSSFRAAGLRVGDRIVEVDGRAVAPPAELDELRRWKPRQPGQYHAYQGWVDAEMDEGDEVTLRVRRRHWPGEGWTEHTATAPLRCERSWNLGEFAGNAVISPHGPRRRQRPPGFRGSWASWLEDFQRHVWKVLDDGMFHRRFDSRRELAAHQEHGVCVEHLLEHHPGPFATEMKKDWDAVHEVLAGIRYELTEEDLAYRELGEQREAEIRTAAETARQSWLEAHAADVIEPFPAIDPITGDRAAVAGRLVVLPDIHRNWVTEPGGVNWAVVQGRRRGDGIYFVDVHGEAAHRLYAASWRYRKLISPRIDDMRLAVVGRIRPDPRMVTVDGRAVTGLEVEPVAVTVDGRMFVDLTVIDEDGDSPFAGEELLVSPPSALPADDASPREVVEAFVAAIEAGDEGTFKALYADWRAVPLEDGRLLWYSWYGYRLDDHFVRARRLVTSRVFDTVVLWVGDVHHVTTGEEFDSAPAIDRVVVEVDHVGSFDGEHRSFTSVSVNRSFVLERVDGGPWRIAEGRRY